MEASTFQVWSGKTFAEPTPSRMSPHTEQVAAIKNLFTAATVIKGILLDARSNYEVYTC